MIREQTTIRLETNLYSELLSISNQSGLNVTTLLIVAMWQHVLKLRQQQQ